MEVMTIDLMFQRRPGLIAAYVLRSANELALIETGPGSCHSALVGGLATLGLAPVDIRHVFLTHIHLDHAGGAGWWAQQGAQVYVHSKGAPHVIDPGKLIDSATRIYGDKMDTLWGPILPAPADRVTILQDGDKVRIGEVDIEALDTPGHARHHLAYAVDGVCFTGDVAGVRLAGCDYLSVAAAPPQFEPGPYVESVERLLAGGYRKLYLAHFGEVVDPQRHLQHYKQRIHDVHSVVAGWMADGVTGIELAQRYREREKTVASVSDAVWEAYEFSNGTAMCAAGIELYVTKSS